MRSRSAFGIALGALFASGVAHAQPPATEVAPHDKAVAAFEEGRKLIDAGNCAAAVVRLKESLALEPSVGAHLSIADCTERDDPLTAWQESEAAAMLAYTLHDDRVAVATQRAQALARRLPTIRIALPPRLLDEPGLAVSVDGVLVDRFLYKEGVIATTPGTHHVEVTVARKHFAQPVVAEMSPNAVRVVLEDDRSAPATAPASASAATRAGAAPIAGSYVATPVPDPGRGQRTIGVVLASAGVVGIGVGAAFGLVTLNRKTELAVACGGDPDHCRGSQAQVESIRSSAASSATLSTLGFVAGGALLAGGVVVALTAPRRPLSLRLAPAVGQGSGGATVAGSFQ